MIKLPEIKRDPRETQDLCKCRPVCKSRRRVWRGVIQKTSAELQLERKPAPLCHRRWPSKVYPNGPCPLFGRVKRPTIKPFDYIHEPNVVRICQGELDVVEDAPYLRYAELAKSLGAWGAVHACCAFCPCGPCCPCGIREYILHDAERAARRRSDMREFDDRVKTDYQVMRIMYDVKKP